jgi:hypothetical protein
VQPGLAVVVAGQVGGGQPHQAGGGAGLDGDVCAGGEAAQQVQAVLLGDGLAGAGLLAGDIEVAGDVAMPGCPDQERADAFALVRVAGGVVGVDVGLGEGGQPHAQVAGPGQEGAGLVEPGLGVQAGGGAQRPGGGPGDGRRPRISNDRYSR